MAPSPRAEERAIILQLIAEATESNLLIDNNEKDNLNEDDDDDDDDKQPENQEHEENEEEVDVEQDQTESVEDDDGNEDEEEEIEPEPEPESDQLQDLMKDDDDEDEEIEIDQDKDVEDLQDDNEEQDENEDEAEPEPEPELEPEPQGISEAKPINFFNESNGDQEDGKENKTEIKGRIAPNRSSATSELTKVTSENYEEIKMDTEQIKKEGQNENNQTLDIAMSLDNFLSIPTLLLLLLKMLSSSNLISASFRVSPFV